MNQKLNLQPFNLGEALKNPKRVVYRNGETPLEWYSFEKANQEDFCIVSVCNEKDILTHYKNGIWNEFKRKHHYDLMLFPLPKKRYWVNVYIGNDGIVSTGKVCEKEEECMALSLKENLIKTISFTI